MNTKMINPFIKKVAFYPAHPEKIVIKSKYYKKPLREEDIWGYYHRIKSKILPFLKDRLLLLRVATGINKDVVVRKDPRKPEKYISIPDEKTFDVFNNGRVLSFFEEMKAFDNYTRIDFDFHESVPWSKRKRITKITYNLLKESRLFEEILLTFSGGKGFHLRGYFKPGLTTADLKREYKKLLKEIKNPHEMPHFPD